MQTQQVTFQGMVISGLGCLINRIQTEAARTATIMLVVKLAVQATMKLSERRNGERRKMGRRQEQL
jgi:hypothetical protein